VRIRKLVVSSAALIAAIIFGVASASAASAVPPYRNAVVTTSTVNAGGFGRSVGRIGADPTSPQTPKNGQCAGAWGNVVSNVVFQRAKTGGLAWGFFLTKIAQEKLGAVVTVDITSATINNRAIHTPYSKHVQSSNYNFHPA
jgi:hypothetical protein